MLLPLEDKLSFGVTLTQAGPKALRDYVALAERLGFTTFWLGDHLIFHVPISDPLIQLAQAATLSATLKVGTAVYLLPLRHPVPVAKQVATLDLLSEGRVIFGVGVGGEYPLEWAAAGVPVKERGPRLSEGIAVLRKLWSGEPVAHDGKFYGFPEVRMLPAPHQPGGPPIWCGGRQEAALRRAGRLADGWMSYVVTPEMYAEGLQVIAKAAAEAKRPLTRFGTSHLLFMRLGPSFEAAHETASQHLSKRYGMDFRGPAKKYAALGRPEDIAAKLAAFHSAGVRHLVLDPIGTNEERPEQYERFANEVRPLLGSLI